MPSKSPQPKSANITSVLKEERVFRPALSFSNQAHIPSFAHYKKIYNASIKNPQKFWDQIATDLHWFKKWNKVLDWKLPFARWFVGGKINVSYNCLDRHLTS